MEEKTTHKKHQSEHSSTPATPASASKMSASKGKNRLLALVGGIVIVLVLFVVGLYIFTRTQVHNLSEQPFVVSSANFFRVPAVKVNGDTILYSEYVNDKDTLAYFYAQQADAFPAVGEQELSDMAVSRLIATTIVEQVAEQWGVQVTQDDLNERRQTLIDNIGSEELAQQEVQANYGWDLDTYMERVVRPLIREEKVQEYFDTQEMEDAQQFQQEEVKARHILFRVEEDSEDGTVKQAAQDVLERIKAGEDFATLAKEFGSDGTAEVGGDLGWFGRGVMVPEFEAPVFAIEPGTVGDELVKTAFGYHIVMVEDKRQGKDFLAFMDQQFNEADIRFLVPIHNPFEDQNAMLQ